MQSQPHFRRVVEQFISEAADDPEVWPVLRWLGERINSVLDRKKETPEESETENEEARPALDDLDEAAKLESVDDTPTADIPKQHDQAGQSTVAVCSANAAPSQDGSHEQRHPVSFHVDDDLPKVAADSRLKAEGARWTAERRRRMKSGCDFQLDIAPTDRDLLHRSRAGECRLWMCRPNSPFSDGLSPWDTLGGCYDALADAVSLATDVIGSECPEHWFEKTLHLMAEAQSALRVAVQEVGGPADHEQQRVFGWLKEKAGEKRIFIERHMKLDDPADPNRWKGLQDRIADLQVEVQEAKNRHSLKRKRLGKARYISTQIAEGQDYDGNWLSLSRTVGELIADGLPPSNIELREMLLPVVTSAPELPDAPQGWELTVREVGRFLETQAACPVAVSPDEPSQEITEIAELLRGKKAVLIGGHCRPEHKASIEAALGLKELIWLETQDFNSGRSFEPYIASEDVALVMLAIRWSRHAFGDVKADCDRYGKPLVRLPGGYNSSQIAQQILNQCSRQLSKSRNGKKPGN